MTEIVALPGSLREGSYNAALIRALAEAAPAGTRVRIETIRGIPVYDGDLEDEHGLPEPVERLRLRVAESDGLILGTPEYNGSVPGPLKNALDWMSRPPKTTPPVFEGKPVGLVGVTPGRLGTSLSQSAWLPVLRNLRTRPWHGALLMVSGAGTLFEGDPPRLTDEKMLEQARGYIEGFARFAAGE